MVVEPKMKVVNGILTNHNGVTQRLCDSGVTVLQETKDGKAFFKTRHNPCNMECAKFKIYRGFEKGGDLFAWNSTEGETYLLRHKCALDWTYPVDPDKATLERLQMQDTPAAQVPKGLGLSGPAKNMRDRFLRTGKKKEKPK